MIMMKKMLFRPAACAMMLALSMSFSAAAVELNTIDTSEDEGSITVIDSIGETGGGDLSVGQTEIIDNVCELTLLGFVADDYAMSIAAYGRDEEETVQTPEVSGNRENRYAPDNYWGKKDRFKLEKNSSTSSYHDMYINIGAALEAETTDYKLLDLRFNILNTSFSPLNLTDKISGKVTYADQYDFDLKCIMSECNDTNGNKNEWLEEAQDIPVLVNRNVHLIFEVPAVVIERTDPLTATLNMFGEEYEIVLR